MAVKKCPAPLPAVNRVIGRTRVYKGYAKALICDENGVAERRILSRHFAETVERLDEGRFCESLDPKILPLKSDPELLATYKKWEASRSGFLQGLKTQDPEIVKQGWQKDYFQGKLAEGGAFDGHQTRLSIKEFEAGG